MDVHYRGNFLILLGFFAFDYNPAIHKSAIACFEREMLWSCDFWFFVNQVIERCDFLLGSAFQKEELLKMSRIHRNKRNSFSAFCAHIELLDAPFASNQELRFLLSDIQAIKMNGSTSRLEIVNILSLP